MNRSLFGLVQEASQHQEFGHIYGSHHGLEGLLAGHLIDLSKPSAREWSRIARTPGASLGSSRRKFNPADMPIITNLLTENAIRYLFIIGGNDSAETGHSIGIECRASGYELTVINIPKTIDNDLVLTDHSPGYGSAARFVALAVMGAGRDAEAMGTASPVTILEVMGRDSGWLAASAALARQDHRDAPHILCIPEVPVEVSHFLDKIEDACQKFGFAVAVVAENTKGIYGVLGEQAEPSFVDDFGHPYFSNSPAQYLATQVTSHLKVRARFEKPGTIQRSLATCVSTVDSQEAEMVGRAAVRYALSGYTDKIVTLIRDPGIAYMCDIGLEPLGNVAGRVKVMPNHYLDTSNGFVTSEFLDYARPLIGRPLPRFGRLG